MLLDCERLIMCNLVKCRFTVGGKRASPILQLLLYIVLKDIKCLLFTLVWSCFLVVDERRCCAEIAMELGFLEVS